jgi:phospholipase C
MTHTAGRALLLLLLATAGLAMQTVGAPSAKPDGRGRIDHMVVLMMENRPFDHFFGCLAGEGRLPGADGAIPPGGKRLPKDPHDASAGSVNISCGAAPYACKKGPGYSVWSGKFPCDTAANCTAYTKPELRNGSVNPSYAPYSEQSSAYSYQQGAVGDAVKMFAPSQLPIKTALATQFGVFNRLFSAVPAASAPNHMMMQSATSCGTATNVEYLFYSGEHNVFLVCSH